MPFNPASLKNLNRGRTADKAPNLPIIVDTALPIKDVDIQQDASQILADAAPDAALLLARLARGQVRAPVHLRMGAAVKVLESQGLLGQQRQGPPPSFPSREVLMQALELGRRSAEAVDATLIPVEGKCD